MDYPKTIKKVNGHPWIYHASLCFKQTYKFNAKKSFQFINHLKLNQYFYDKFTVILIEYNCYDEPVFAKIDYIIKYCNVYFICVNILDTIKFDQNVFAYEVDFSNKFCTIKFSSLENLETSIVSYVMKENCQIKYVNW
jgi:hypothetical protein